jgi:hypothetical protein
MPRTFHSCFLVFLLAGSTAHAEPLRLTSGVATLTDEPGSFSLAGRGFVVEGGWWPTVVSGTFWWSRCGLPGCTVGAPVNFGTTTYGFAEHESTGRGVVAGVTYERLFFGGELTFSGPHVTALPTRAGDGPAVPQLGAFSFAGHIAGYADESRVGDPLFALHLVGAGTAAVWFSDATGGRVGLHDLEYRFTNAEPIPEPSTVFLLATAVAVAASRLKRRTRGTRE